MSPQNKLFFALLLLFLFLVVPKAFAQPCPAGYTCPSTKSEAEFGETFEIVSGSTKAADFDGIGGKTGPKLNSLKFPDLSEENGYYSSRELHERALPADLVNQLEFKEYKDLQGPKLLKGTVAHVGCETVSQVGVPAKTTPSKSEFSATQDYNSLILVTDFWQSIFVPAQTTSLKYALTDPQSEPVPDYFDKCNSAAQGTSGDATQITNPAPEPLSLLVGIVRDIRNKLFELIGRNPEATVSVAAKIQQVKYLPGEKEFEKRKVGEEVFVNIVRAEDQTFTKPGDQKENVPYLVGGNETTKDVSYKGMSSFQSGTVDLYNSMFPHDQVNQYNFEDLATNAKNAQSEGLNYTIPYRKTDIELSPELKARVIKAVQQSWPDSQIAERWDQIVSEAIVKGINPAFALTVFIEESGGGAPSVGADSAFGCLLYGVGKYVPFDQSLSCFIKTTNSIQPPDFTRWASNYCGKPAPGYAICTINEAGDDNSNFARNIKNWYNTLVPQGTDGALQYI